MIKKPVIHIFKSLFVVEACLSVVELSVHINLTLSDVASQIRNGVSDVIIWHRQDWNLCNRAIPTLNTTSSLNTERKKESIKLDTETAMYMQTS